MQMRTFFRWQETGNTRRKPGCHPAGRLAGQAASQINNRDSQPR